MLEMLLAMLILSMATSVILGGMPAAVNAYVKVVDYANAQVLLTTTMTRLRDELGTGRDVNPGDDSKYSGEKQIEYINVYGNKLCVHSVHDDGDDPEARGIYLEYTIPNPEEGEDDKPDTIIAKFPLVANGTAPKNLYADYGEVDYTGGVLTIRDLCVMKASETLASVDEFKIRVLSYVP